MVLSAAAGRQGDNYIHSMSYVMLAGVFLHGMSAGRGFHGYGLDKFRTATSTSPIFSFVCRCRRIQHACSHGEVIARKHELTVFHVSRRCRSSGCF